MSESYLGSCLCARISYKLLTPPQLVTHCHCKMCQKSHGAAFSSYGVVPRNDLCIVTGEDDIKSYASSEAVFRKFCQHCGSSLFWSMNSGTGNDWICVALGTLDSPFTTPKEQHFNPESRPSWSPVPKQCIEKVLET